MSMRNHIIPLLPLLFVFVSFASFGQARTTSQAGPWSSTATWGGNSVPNTTAFGTITINHAVTIDAIDYPVATPLQVDQVVVGAAGTLTVNSGAALQIANGAGIDLSVNAVGSVTFTSGSEFHISTSVSFTTSAANTTFQSGSVVRTAAANLPISTGLNAIDIYIQGVTAATLTINNTWNQLGASTNLYVNCPSLGNNAVNFSGFITSLNSLNITDTDGDIGGRVTLATSGVGTLSVGSGGVNISGDSRIFLATTGTSTLNLIGDLNFSSSSTLFSQNATSGTGTINFNGGDFVMSSGLWRVSASGTGGNGYFYFNNSTSDMNVTGGTISENGANPAQGTFSFLSATGNQNITWSTSALSTGTLNLIINKASGNVNQLDDLTAPAFALTNGHLITNGNDLILNGNVTVTSGLIDATTPTFFTVNGAGTLPATIPFVASSIFSNLTLNRSGALLSTSNASMADGGLITITAGTLSTAIPPLGVYDVYYNNTATLTTGSEIPVSTTVLRNLTHAGTSTVNLASAATINGDFAINTNTFATSTNSVSVVGDFTNNASFTQTSGTLTFLTRTPSNIHVWSGTSTATLGELTINGDLTLSNLTTTLAAGSLTIQSASSLNATSGTFSFSNALNSNFDIVNNGTTIEFNNINIGTGESMTPPLNGTFNVSGNWAGNGTFVHNGSTVIFDGTSILSGSTKTFNNLTVSTSSSLSGATGFGIVGDLVNDGTINFTAGTLTWNSSGTFSGTSYATLNNISITSGQTLNLSLAANLVVSGSLTLTSPSGNLNHTTSNDLSIGGNMTGNGSISSTGRVIFTGAAAAMNGTGAKNFQGLRVTGTLTVGANTSYSLNNVGSLDVETGATMAIPSGGTSITTIAGTITVINTGLSTTLNALAINGTLNAAGTIILNGNFTNSGSFVPGTGSIRFNNTGAATKSITSSNTIEFNNISVDNNGNATDFINNVTGSLNLRGVLTLTDAVFDADGAANDKVFVVQSFGDNPTQDASIAAMSAAASVTGSITVQRYMGAEGRVNRYISSPVTGVDVVGLTDDFTINNNQVLWYREWIKGSYGTGWTSGGLATNMNPGLGILVMPATGTGNVIWDLTGPIASGSNKGDVTLPISYTISTPALPDVDGWNLVGNPYPSSIVWNTTNPSMWTVANIDPTISVPDIGGGWYYTWDGSTATGDLPGGIVSTGQAFWIKANALSPSLIVHEQAKTATAGEFFRKQNSDLPTGFKVTLSTGNIRDNSFLLIREGATEYYDRGMDAAKLEGDRLAISFQDPNGVKLGHYATDKIENAIPLKVHASVEGNYSISFETIRGYEGLHELFLVDTYLGKSHSLASGNAYTFSVTGNPNTKSGRFFLSKDPTSVKEKEVKISVWPNPVETTFDLEINTPHTVFADLMNSRGEPLMSAQIIPTNGIARGKMDMEDQSTGLYFLKIKIDGRVSAVKILKK
jgi:hypothetical protein